MTRDRSAHHSRADDRESVRLRAVRACLLAAACVLATTPGCGGGGGEDPAPTRTLRAEFHESGTPAAPDLVRLRGEAAGEEVRVDVVIGGVTSSSDLYSFAFDLVISTSDSARFISGSEEFGSALTLENGQTSQVLAAWDGRRLTVGITKVGGGDGNGVDTIEDVVASFRFRVLRRGSTEITIQGSPPHDPSALDSAGDPVPTVRFDDQPAVMVGG